MAPGSPDRWLMIDAWMQWDVATTLAIAERLAPLDIGWIEEPLSPDDLEGYAELAERSPVRIAGGEIDVPAAVETMQLGRPDMAAEPALRSLDAIHVATAVHLYPIDAFVTSTVTSRITLSVS